MTSTIAALDQRGDDNAKLDLIRKTYAKELNQDEFALLVAEGQQRNLSVINKELIGVRFKGVVTNFVTLAGLRRLAERSGDVRGTKGPFWKGKTGPWVDVWLEDTPPAAAKFEVYRFDSDMPYVGIAIWKERKGTKNDGGLMPTWAAMPALMLAKVAETDAYKRARVVSETEQVSYDGDDDLDAPGASIRVSETKNKAMGAAHAIGTHEEVKRVVKAINPGAGESLKDASVTAADLSTAAEVLDEFGDAAYDVITTGPEDDPIDGGPSLRELWRNDLRDAFAEWNKARAAEIRQRLEDGDDWMWGDAVELAPSKPVRDRLIDAALSAGVDASILESASNGRRDNTQVARAAEREREG